MGFDRRHGRGEVLRHLGGELDAIVLRADGDDGSPSLLEQALELPGVADTFTDDVDLVAVLLLRWHARLSTSIERALARGPRDLPGAVAQAWVRAAGDAPGVRRLLDEQLEAPSGAPMAALVERARDKERARLAFAAGLGAGESARTVAVGARLEQAARDRWALSTGSPTRRDDTPVVRPLQTSSARLARRIRALIPA